MIIQTTGLHPPESDQIDAAPNVSREDPSGADQIDEEHQATDLAVGGSNLSGAQEDRWSTACDRVVASPGPYRSVEGVRAGWSAGLLAGPDDLIGSLLSLG
jgi:hypothetical protein